MLFGRPEMALVELADRRGQRKQSARVEPFRKVVLRGVVLEDVVGNRRDEPLHLVEILRPADHTPRREVFEEKIAEGEPSGDEVRQLLQQRLRILGDEPCTQLARLRSEGRLRRLQQHRHQRVVGPHQPAQVDARVELLGRRGVALVQHEPHVRDDAQQVLLISLVERHGIGVIGRQQDLGTGALAQDLLLFVEGVFQELGVLLQDQLVERRQIGRIETHRILDEQDGLHAPCEDVLLGVHRILDEFDDADHQIGIAAPREDVVDARSVALVDTAVDVLRETGQQHDRDMPVALLDDLGEVEHVGFAHVVHREDEVEPIVLAEQVERLGRRADAQQRRRVGHVQVDVLLVDLLLDMAVLFQNVPVVAATYQQNLADAVLHELVARCPFAVRRPCLCVVFHSFVRFS